MGHSCCLFMIPFFLILSPTFNFILVSAQCLQDQSLLLMQFKDGLKFLDSEKSTKLVKWNVSVDCCTWNGVECDTSGRVTSLELDGESISSGIENATSVFKLQFLQKLNLANNEFNDIQIPSGISNLQNLVYLNLSGAGFSGQIPIELSYLRKLVSLDLSGNYRVYNTLELENPNLKTLVRNLNNLEELYLDEVYMSMQNSNWSQALATSLPRLRILSLRDCLIKGPIDASLSKLHYLSVIQLDRNILSTTIPDLFANFSNLTTLSLRDCGLVGTFPAKILQVPTLQYLDLSFNQYLNGGLEEYSHNGSFRTIGLSNLHNLNKIDLSFCNFSGPIPPSMENLSKLVYLDFSDNSFTGPIPLFHNSKNLSYINFRGNELTGSLSPAHFGGLLNLEYLNLDSNSLTGSIPSSIFSLPSLKSLYLSSNQLSGQIYEFPNALSSLLDTLDLSNNRLNGSIPESIFELKKLSTLSLSSNSFSGTIQLESIINLVNLSSLHLSHNKFSVDPRISNPSMLPQLKKLGLASCKLKIFPELSNQSNLSYLDLSDNQIKGEVPNWIWNVTNGYDLESAQLMNLSCNLLVGLQKPYTFPHYLTVLDLHSNHLQGEIPIPPASAIYVDYSSNNFTNSIPPGIGNNIYNIGFFFLANNSLTGSIPKSLCNANLEIIDFSDNFLTGKIPSCFPDNNDLSVLNLARNNLTGNIPDSFRGFSGLQTLDLSSNALEGKIPGSLINCTYLEVLNVGNNILEDTFPCNLKNSSTLRVIVLRSNKFYGDVLCHGSNNFWPELQIIDIASNNFTGDLTPDNFSGWKRMMLDDDNNSEFKGDYLRSDAYRNDLFYQNKVIVTIKGQEFELVKILKIFTSIDFSNNKFAGEIPDIIGDLKSLYLLNLSHNAFTGRIPSSIGKLKSLGSLDMSRNQLTGEIPATLASLTFLSFFNLSFNKLSGRIPTGPQLQTFTSASYKENSGLCGFPLNKTCTGDERPPPISINTASTSKNEIKWEYVLAATGYSVGIASFILVLLLCKSWREKYNYYVDKLLLKIVKQKGGTSIAEHWFRNQAMRRL